MSINNGQPVDAENSNPAWISKNTDDTAFGKYNLENSEAESGDSVVNIQRAHNNAADGLGGSTSDPAVAKTYGAPASTIDDGDNHKIALKKLANKFDPSVGHGHTGANGDGKPIDSQYIVNTPLNGIYVQGANLTGVSGSSWDVSTEMSGKIPSNNDTTVGVVVNNPYNKVFLRDLDNQEIVDPSSGEEVYARITESADVWTLTFYIDLAGVETPYTIPSSIDIKWFYEGLFDPTQPGYPVYDHGKFISSDNATADVLPASETIAGKVKLAGAAPADIAETGAKGSSTKAAKEDHTHAGATTQDVTRLYNEIHVTPSMPGTYTEIGTINRPYKSAVAAIATITDASNTKRYSLLVRGYANETLVGKDFVSIFGPGGRVISQLAVFNYTSTSSSSILSLIDLRVRNSMSIDNSAATGNYLYLERCQISNLTMANNPAQPSPEFRDCLLSGTTNINSGYILFENCRISGTFNIAAGATCEFRNCSGYATVNMTGLSTAYFFNTKQGGQIIGIPVGADKPTVYIDAASFPFPRPTESNFAAVIRTSAASDIQNDSSVSGATVKDALNSLLGAGVTKVQEAPSGLINGTNVTFTLAATPKSNFSVLLFINGLLQRQGTGLDYTISGATITMTTAPAVDQTIWAQYEV